MKQTGRLKNILLNEVSIFIYLWLIYLFFPPLLDLELGRFSISTTTLVITFYYIILTSVNNFYLIPRYLSEGRYWLYLSTIVLTLIGFSLLEESVLEYYLRADQKAVHLSVRGAWFSFIRMGTIVILFGSFKLIWDYQNKLRKISALEKERVESELKFLKSQINPHVMFNNLNSIYYYALENSKKVPQMILKLSEIMRYMIYEANEKVVPLSKELAYIKNFIELERIRMEDRGIIQFNIEGDPNHYRIAPLLLISFIENSFKHSMETRHDDIWINIEIEIKDGWLTFIAVNNWSRSKDKSERPPSSGIGLKNVKKRLDLLYNNKYVLNIDETDDLFKVYLNLKLHDGED